MKTSFFLFLSTLCLGLAAEAAGGAHGDGVPTKTIFWQVFNLAILIGALTYFLKDGIRSFFAGRESDFVNEAKKSETAKKEAEKRFLDIQHKIEHLENTREESLARAEAEAADLRKQLLKEAQEIATRVRREAEETARIEAQRARLELHRAFVAQSVEAAKTVLSKDIGSQDHQRLQSEFNQNIQTVTT